MEVVPFKGVRENQWDFLVLFVEAAAGNEPQPAGVHREGEKSEQSLAQELEATREYLRSILQDHEASNEELRAANEEILSSNEELESTNEELETAKEELQSANEELTTLNDELSNRNQELTQLTTDLGNVLTGVDIPIVILSPEKTIRRFTPAAEGLLNLIPSDVGRPITNIKANVDLPDMEELLSRLIRTGQSFPATSRTRTGTGMSCGSGPIGPSRLAIRRASCWPSWMWTP